MKLTTTGLVLLLLSVLILRANCGKEENTLLRVSQYLEGSPNVLSEDVKVRNINEADGSLLLDLVRNGALQLRADDIRQKSAVNVKRDEVYAHLLQNGGLQTDFSKPSIGFMLQVFEDLLDGKGMNSAVGHTDDHTRDAVAYSDTIRSFTAKRYKDENSIFNLPALPKHEHAKMAEVRFLSNVNTNKRQRFVIIVRRENKNLVKVSTRTTKTGFIYLPRKIISYINHFHGNVSIILRKKSKNSKSSFSESAPILVIYSSDNGFMKSVYKSYTSSEQLNDDHDNTNTLQRRKRSIKSEQQNKKARRNRKTKWTNKKREPCKMHDFRVDFDLIGWGPWIIHPKTFNARVCFGQCPSPVGHEYTPTNHAMLQTLMKMKRPRSAPEPCCVPVKLRPLSMLYFEYDDIVVRHHEDMIVSECGCR